MKYFPAFMKVKCINYYRIYLVRTSAFEVYKYSKNLDFEKVTGRHAALVEDNEAWN